MDILGKTISEKTAVFVSSIEQSVRLPIQYLDNSTRPNTTYRVFGTVDTHPLDGIYKVWLMPDLTQEDYEANLLHELHHIVQVESGYSEVYNKNTVEFHSKDRAFIQEVGAHLSSFVLDMDVDIWLERNGYSQEHFFRTNYDSLIANCHHQYTLLNDPLNFANLSLALLHIASHFDDDAAQTLFNAYSTYPKVINAASKLRNTLRAMKIDNPTAAAHAHCLIIDFLELWKYFYVISPDIKIRTRKEYLDYLDSLS